MTSGGHNVRRKSYRSKARVVFDLGKTQHSPRHRWKEPNKENYTICSAVNVESVPEPLESYVKGSKLKNTATWPSSYRSPSKAGVAPHAITL